MSKTSQRKQSMFNQGKQDAIAFHGRYYRWKKHPLKKNYGEGFKAGLKTLKPSS